MKLLADEELTKPEKIGLLKLGVVLTTALQVVEAEVIFAEMVIDVG
jgi:hypothetical protein